MCIKEQSKDHVTYASHVVAGTPTSGSCAAEMDCSPYLFSVLGYYWFECRAQLSKLWVWQARRKGASEGCPHSSCEQPSRQTLVRKLGISQNPVPGLQRPQDPREGGPRGLAPCPRAASSDSDASQPWGPLNPPVLGPGLLPRGQAAGGYLHLPPQIKTAIPGCPQLASPRPPALVLRARLQPAPRAPGRGVP